MEKRRGYSEKNCKLVNVSNLVKIKLKHANSKIKSLSMEIKSQLNLCNLCLHFLTSFLKLLAR